MSEQTPTVEEGRTVQTSWTAMRVGRPIRMRANIYSIEMSNDDDGLHLASIPLPERYSTRISLARVILGASFDLAAQPDRPEPVDPASVLRETGPPSPKMLREAANILETAPYERVNTAAWLRDVAHTLEEPDPAAVEALAQAIVGIPPALIGDGAPLPARIRWASEVARKTGLVVPDA